MGNFFSLRPAENFQTTKEESWIERVRQNARAFLELRGAPVLADGGAGAFDLLEERPSPGSRRRRASSLAVHAVVIGVLLWLGGHTPKDALKLQLLAPERGPLTYAPLKDIPARDGQERGKGAGGAKDQLPPSAGDWAAQSRVLIIHPRLPDNIKPALPVEPTIFDANVNENRHVDLGLPIMKDRNHSDGRNGEDGIGAKPGHGMGLKNGDEEGDSDYNGLPVQGAYSVKCVYCPDPEYTDEARHEKLQGSVTLEVLVTVDGRAGRVKIVKGLGLGLDERAMETVRKWRFQPARDGARNPIPTWVTVETAYRLF